MNVLIAKDDAVTRLMLQRAVEHDGHACLVAPDGLEAWQLFQAHTVDVVIAQMGYCGSSRPSLCTL